LGIFKQYWHKAAAGMNRAFGRQAASWPRLEALERELLDLSAQQQTLAGNLERIRTDFERRWSVGFKQLTTLEQTCRQTEAARLAETSQLGELEQRLSGIETGHEQECAQIAALETSLTETEHRLETRNNQLKFLQDSAREQHQHLKTALAETASRLESRGEELRELQDALRTQVAALESSQAETTRHADTMDRTIGELRDYIGQQGRRIDAFLVSASARLEANDNRLQAQEKALDVAQRLQQNQYQDMKLLLRRQQVRVTRAIALVVFALLLVAIAGVLMIALRSGS
jgi:chromosome segregation ATPase